MHACVCVCARVAKAIIIIIFINDIFNNQLTGKLKIFSSLSLRLNPFFGRIIINISRISGQHRSIFSTYTLPRNPVAPVKNILCPA